MEESSAAVSQPKRRCTGVLDFATKEEAAEHPQNLVFELVSHRITDGFLLAKYALLSRSTKRYIAKHAESLWKTVTQVAFASYPFFHKALVGFDPTTLDYHFHSLPQFVPPDEVLDELEKDENRSARDGMIAEIEGREVREELVRPANLMWTLREMLHWESLYKFRVRHLLEDYRTLKRVVLECGVEWTEDFGKLLRLGLVLITDEMRKSHGEADEHQKKYEDYVVMSTSFLKNSDATTQLGLGVSRPKTEPKECHNSLPIQSATGQILLSDLDQFLTPIGILPRKGMLSLYFRKQEGIVFYDPSVGLETECNIILPSAKGVPSRVVEGFVETLHFDTMRSFPALGYGPKRTEISEKYNQARRVGSFPVDQLNLIGGPAWDLQGNLEIEENEFLLLQSDFVQKETSVQVFFVGEQVDFGGRDFSKISAGVVNVPHN